jgi:tripeptide aminopeptidase
LKVTELTVIDQATSLESETELASSLITGTVHAASGRNPTAVGRMSWIGGGKGRLPGGRSNGSLGVNDSSNEPYHLAGRHAVSDVVSLFTDLAATPSPSGEEGEVSGVVESYLQALGIEVVRDDAGRKVGSNTGNLLARLNPTARNGGVPIFLCAHLDTVPSSGPIRPIVVEGIVRNDAATILGADNKAAVAVMLEAVKTVVTTELPHAGIELLFTVKEETGSEGVKVFEVTKLRARTGFVYDHSGPIGGVVVAAPYHATLRMDFTGRAAHAGINPEDGRSAVVALAQTIASLTLGRVDNETTANIGVIKGGTACNVVPDRSQLVGEARSRNKTRLAAFVDEMVQTSRTAASLAGCEVQIEVEPTYPGYRFERAALPVQIALAGLKNAGFEAWTFETDGGTDANLLNGRGLECLNLSNGMMQPHTPSEHIAISDLEAMVGVTLSLVEAARTVSSEVGRIEV